MYWYFIKLNETAKLIIYAYGFESKDTTGQFEYDKKTKKANIIKYANNHSEKSDFNRAVYQLMKDYSHLDKKLIAYG